MHIARKDVKSLKTLLKPLFNFYFFETANIIKARQHKKHEASKNNEQQERQAPYIGRTPAKKQTNPKKTSQGTNWAKRKESPAPTKN